MADLFSESVVGRHDVVVRDRLFKSRFQERLMNFALSITAIGTDTMSKFSIFATFDFCDCGRVVKAADLSYLNN